MVEDNPLDLKNIKEKQDEDNDLSQSLLKHPTWYSCKNTNDVNGISCYTKPGDNVANWKIASPSNLIRPTIMCFIIKSQDILGVRGSINTYINNTIIVTYVDLLTTSTATIAKEIN